MTKPWGEISVLDETWLAEGDAVRIGGEAVALDWLEPRLGGMGLPEARARLAAAAPEMARVLLEVEWAGDEKLAVCPHCGRGRVGGHSDDCELVSVLRKAGVMP